MHRCCLLQFNRFAFAWLVLAAVAGGQSGRPAFQYELGETRVSIPSADEPRVKQFGRDSLQDAGKYLETGAVSWARGRACVNCHTTGPYLTEYTAWSKYFGKPSEEVRQTFVAAVPKEIKPVEPTEKNGHKYYPSTFSSVWRSAGLAEWDRHVTGKLSEETDRSLRDMFERQSPSGAFVSHGEVEVPHITTDFELSLQAARAITAAPGWLKNLQDEALLARVAKLKDWLRTSPPKNDFDRVLKLQLVAYFPELVSQAERDAALQLLSSKQHPDGGWSTRDMSPVNDWHFEMSPTVLKIFASLPDKEDPASDAYMTALAVVLMRQNNVPVADPRIQQGLAWLKREQRETGRWWMHSLYRGNLHYITYIATVEALKALDLCGELEATLVDPKPAKDAKTAQANAPAGKPFVYKHSAGQPRQMEVYFPPDHDPAKSKVPGLILFHGGGWSGGNLQQFRQACGYFAERGLVCATAEYRMLTAKEAKLLPAGETKKRVCVTDAKSAIRWFKQKAPEFGVDPTRIITGGGSAGGHISVLATTNPSLNDPADPKDIDTKVVAYLLFNPAFTADDQQDPEIDALKHVPADFPPAIVFFGDQDKWKTGWDALHDKLKAAGNKSVELQIAAGQAHGFFNRAPWQEATLAAADQFLVQQGLLTGQPKKAERSAEAKLTPAAK